MSAPTTDIQPITPDLQLDAEPEISGSVTVVRLTEVQLIEQMREAVAGLLREAGTTDLTEALRDAMDYQISHAGHAHFEQLSALIYLGGLPRLPCCAAHPQEEFTAVVEAIQDVLAAGALPS